MDLQKAKILLEKINALHKSMSADAKNISSIERDLMRSYVQQLYEVFLDLPGKPAPAEAPPVEIFKTSPKVTLRKPEPAEPKPETETPKAAPPPPEPAPPMAEKIPEPARPITPPPPPPPPVREETPAPAPPPKPEPKPAPLPEVNGELEELFAFSSARELSEKLSELPITDIKKAMGLNERIFTVNELFGGSQEDFEAALTALNQLRNYDEAKNYLLRNIAGKYDWASKDKKSKAKNFIKLVKRRYN